MAQLLYLFGSVPIATFLAPQPLLLPQQHRHSSREAFPPAESQGISKGPSLEVAIGFIHEQLVVVWGDTSKYSTSHILKLRRRPESCTFLHGISTEMRNVFCPNKKHFLCL